MNWTVKLQEILTWIASHASKLRRKDYEPPNHLAGAFVYFLYSKSGEPAQTFLDEGQTTLNNNPIILGVNGDLPGLIILPKQEVYRVVIRERNAEHGGPGAVLFTQDNVWAI